MSDTSREKYYVCQNKECGYIYRTVEQIVSSVLESQNPNPKVNIPFGPQGKHRAQAPQPPT